MLLLRKLYFSLMFFMSLFGIIALAKNPFRALILYSENHFFENLTIIICSVAFLLSVTLLFKKQIQKSEQWFWLWISIILVLFIGDEASWGFATLKISKSNLAGVEIDSVHDIFSVLVKSINQSYLLIIFLSLLAAILIIFVIKIGNSFFKYLRPESFFFFCISIILTAAAIYIDEDKLVKFAYKMVLEETLETLAALALLFLTITGFARHALVQERIIDRNRKKLPEAFNAK